MVVGTSDGFLPRNWGFGSNSGGYPSSILRGESCIASLAAPRVHKKRIDVKCSVHNIY
jgi:hypothetical protein